MYYLKLLQHFGFINWAKISIINYKPVVKCEKKANQTTLITIFNIPSHAGVFVLFQYVPLISKLSWFKTL